LYEVYEVVIQDFDKLVWIEPGVFEPISGQLQEINIRNNSILKTIDRNVFIGIIRL